jgi:hypothetical protein
MCGDAKSEHFEGVVLLANCGAVNGVGDILVIEFWKVKMFSPGYTLPSS